MSVGPARLSATNSGRGIGAPRRPEDLRSHEWLADAGIAALPEPLARAELELGQLVRLLPAHRLPVLHFHAVYLGNLAPPAKTRAFIDLAKERIRDRL